MLFRSDVSQWNAVLRSAAGYHAFRRLHPSGMAPADVAGFLLFHLPFPRSVAASVDTAARTLAELRDSHALTGGAEALGHLEDLRALLRGHTPATVIRAGLHEFLDDVQRRLIAVSRDLARDFFGIAPVSAAQ